MKMAMGWLHLLILVSETLSKRDCLQLGIYSFFTISVSCFVYILFVLCCKRWYISKRKLANLRSYLFTRINIYIFFFWTIWKTRSFNQHLMPLDYRDVKNEIPLIHTWYVSLYSSVSWRMSTWPIEEISLHSSVCPSRSPCMHD